MENVIERIAKMKPGEEMKFGDYRVKAYYLEYDGFIDPNVVDGYNVYKGDKFVMKIKDELGFERFEKLVRKQKAKKPLKTCYWHGSDATIIGGSKRDGYVLLVGSFTDDEARKVKKFLEKEDPQLEEYGEQIVFAEPDEFNEQQF